MLSTVCKVAFATYILSSFKSLPGVYFLRFYHRIVQNIIFKTNVKHNAKILQSHPLGAMAQTKLTTYASPFECDLYLHKNNATYFTELDISRGDLMTKIFQKMFVESKNPLTPKGSWPYLPVANVFTNFLKQINPFEKYNVYSSVICWDDKWIYVLSRFTKNNDKVLCSISLTKYVFKNGRKTINPRDALIYCGLYNDEVEARSKLNYNLLTTKCGFHETEPLEKINFSEFIVI